MGIRSLLTNTFVIYVADENTIGAALGDRGREREGISGNAYMRKGENGIFQGEQVLTKESTLILGSPIISHSSKS